MYKIENEYLEVEISEKAAEVYSFKLKGQDYNYVWSGDPQYWSGRNPILFPQVGHNSNKTITVNGVTKPIGNHGFARNSTFNLVEQKQDELTLSLKENEETLACYPYKFELKVNYKLVNSRLNINYTISNNDNVDMPYGFGLHPAFACSHNYEDTKVVFNEKEQIGNEVIINQELFDKYETFVIDNPKSTKASLISKDKKISIEYNNYNIFAIWSKGDFVCLEPWINHTQDNPSIELKDRKGNIILKPGETKTHTYAWLLEE